MTEIPEHPADPSEGSRVFLRDGDGHLHPVVLPQSFAPLDPLPIPGVTYQGGPLPYAGVTVTAPAPPTRPSWVTIVDELDGGDVLIRYWPDERHARLGMVPTATAARSGVLVRTLIEDGADYVDVKDLLLSAWAAVRDLREGRDVRDLATHVRYADGTLTPVAPHGQPT